MASPIAARRGTIWNVVRSGLSSVFMLLVLLCGGLAEVDAQAPAKKPATVQKSTVTTKDGAVLHLTYYPSAAGKNAPVVVLLHGKGGNRLVWQAGSGQYQGFAQAMQANEFAVVNVDLRLHGENLSGEATAKSKNTNLTARDHQAMVAMDMEAVKKFIFEEHQKQQLNMNKLGIVGVDMSASVALLYADVDWSKEPYDDAVVPAQRTPRGQDVKALALVSPDTKVPGLVTNQAVAKLRTLQLPVLIVVGKKDNLDKGNAKKLHDLLMPKEVAKPHSFLVELDTNVHGTDMLNKGLGLEQTLFKFLDEHVKKGASEWRDRKSPLQD